MKIHPIADVLPRLSEKDYQELKDSIKANGLMAALVAIERDGERMLIDGRHRLRACEELGITPEVDIYDAADDELGVLVWGANGIRRHLTPSQRAAFYTELCGADSIALGKQKRAEHLNRGPEKATLPERETSEELSTRDKIAEVAGVSPRTVQDAITVQQADPELFEQVKEGKVAVSAAARQVRGQADKPKPEQSSQVGKIVELFRMMGDGRIRALKEVIKTLEQHQRHVLLDWLETMIDHVEES